MSQKAIADPEELDRFAIALQQFNSQLSDSTRRLKGQFDRLGETWLDQEHRKFAHEFEQTMRVLDSFIKTSSVHAPFLRRKAQRIRDYLRQR